VYLTPFFQQISMKNKITQLGLITYTLLVFISCSKEMEQKNALNDSDPELVAIQKTIDGLYANIHVEEGKLPDFEVLLSHFAPEARLGSVTNNTTSLKSAGEYFEGWMAMMEQYQPQLLEEFEIEGKSQYFGNIAYHTSLYGVHVNTRDSLTERGIINYQLVKLNNDWKVLSMIWESEKPEKQINSDYFR